MTKISRRATTVREARGKVSKAYDFLKYMLLYNVRAVARSRQCLEELARQRIGEISIYGAGDTAELLYDLTFDVPIKIRAIYNDWDGERFRRFDVLPIEACTESNERVIIASLVGVEEKIERLKELGVDSGRIVVL